MYGEKRYTSSREFCLQVELCDASQDAGLNDATLEQRRVFVGVFFVFPPPKPNKNLKSFEKKDPRGGRKSYSFSTAYYNDRSYS